MDGDEIELNFQAPVHLSALFTPHLMKQPEAAIVQVTSGLAFNPLAVYPVMRNKSGTSLVLAYAQTPAPRHERGSD